MISLWNPARPSVSKSPGQARISAHAPAFSPTRSKPSARKRWRAAASRSGTRTRATTGEIVEDSDAVAKAMPEMRALATTDAIARLREAQRPQGFVFTYVIIRGSRAAGLCGGVGRLAVRDRGRGADVRFLRSARAARPGRHE